MAKTKISEFSTTAGNNTDINSINIAEGCAPSGINDAIRELMRQLKEFQTGGAGDSVNSGGDFSVATNKFTVASASGNTAVAGTLGATGDFAVNTNKFTVAASSGNTAVAGTFAVTGATTLTGALVANGNSTLGDADTDTVTLNASFVNGTTLKTAKSDTNTLALAAYDVDGTAYTNLVTLTAGNSPTLALTSTGVGTINNMSIGATTASTGAFTTLSASGNVTLSGGTANGVLYLNGSKVATSGSALTFDGTNMGLGTASAASLGSSIPTLELKGAITSRTGGLRLRSSDNSMDGYFYADVNGFFIGSGSATDVRFGYGGSEAMRLTSTGLGIGTSSPARRLVVQATDSTTNTKYIVSQFNRASSGTAAAGVGGQIQFQAQDDAGTQREAALIGWDLSDVSAASPKGRLFLGSRGVNDAVVIDNSGNLGLGVTPSAWGTSFKALQVGGGSLWVNTSSAANTVHFSRNTYYDGSNLKYIATSTASMYDQDGGQHIWYNAASGTAGTAITFTQALTLNTNGALVLKGGDTSASGVGIAFPATQSASSNANTLDDYEEGTWTATLVSSGGGSVTVTSSAKYIKVGNLVFVSVESYSISTTGLSAGDLTITGLPFTCNTNSPAIAYFDIAGAVTASVGSVMVYAPNSTTMSIFKTESTTAGVALLQKADLNSNVSIRFNGTYTV